MKNAKKTQFIAILLLVVSGCATRDNTDFQLFHVQTTILVEETATAMESAQLFAEMNMVETIVEGDGELLENLVLEREDAFTLGTDSTSMVAGLFRAADKVDEAALTLITYSLLLAEITESNRIAFEQAALTELNSGILTAAIAVLVEHGTIEHDAERTVQAMQIASPAIETLSAAMAELTETTANTVQATYADMSVRRQREITEEGYPLEAVRELVALNQEATALLDNLNLLHNAWLSIPAVHTELMNSLTETSISATLRILSERMNEIRKEKQ